MREADVKAIVMEALIEQDQVRRSDIDAVVVKTIATDLTSFGLEEGDQRELRADFQHLRRWRRNVEQAQSYALKAVITRDRYRFPRRRLVGYQGHAWQVTRVAVGVSASPPDWRGKYSRRTVASRVASNA